MADGRPGGRAGGRAHWRKRPLLSPRANQKVAFDLARTRKALRLSTSSFMGGKSLLLGDDGSTLQTSANVVRLSANEL